MIENCLTPAAKARQILQQAKETWSTTRPTEIYDTILRRVNSAAEERDAHCIYTFWTEELGPIMNSVIERLTNDGFTIVRDSKTRERISIAWEADEREVSSIAIL